MEEFELKNYKNLENNFTSTDIFHEIVHLAALGLTGLSWKNTSKGTEELLKNSVLYTLENKQDNALAGFILAREISDKFFEISFATHPKYQGRGLAKSLIREACRHFSKHKYLTATTQNAKVYFAVSKVTQQILAPKLHDKNRFAHLNEESQRLLDEVASLRNLQISNTGVISRHFRGNGLYLENINEGIKNFPINSLKGDAILIIAENIFWGM
ncbi:MAG: GNAT family N-acetyltransferase [Richelia sp. RM1_1_1]|nr:GNAT family N-acetyltransferase [Richelia sp. RM1_1_1]